MKSIKPENLKAIIGYQKLCKNEAPVTTIATFRLSELEQLIKQTKERIKVLRPALISKNGEINLAKEAKCHTICITFVREKIKADKTLTTCHSNINPSQLLIKNSSKKRDRYYTQIIPIIAGCLSDLDGKYCNKRFKYLRDVSKKNIPFIHPGGEGSGLIPPPPTANDEDFS